MHVLNVGNLLPWVWFSLATQDQAQKHILFHRKNSHDPRTRREGSTSVSMKTFPFSCFFALALVLASIFFFGKTEHEARPRDVFKLFYYQQIKVLVLSSQEVFPRWQRKKEVLRKGFQKRCDSCLLFMTMVRFH